MGIYDDVGAGVFDSIGIVIDENKVEMFKPVSRETIIFSEEFANIPVGCIVSFTVVKFGSLMAHNVKLLPQPVNFKIILNEKT